MDPRTGALVWSAQVAAPGDIQPGFSIGGFIGSSATWRGNVFGGTAIGGPPWYHSLRGTDGGVPVERPGRPDLRRLRRW